MSDCHITAILTPAPGKSARMQELLHGMCAKVHEKEQDAHRYLMTTELGSDNPRIIFIEQYKDKATADHHASTDYFKELFGTLEKEGLMGAEPTLIHSTSAGGYDLDRKLIKP